MADTKISALIASATPLAGSEVLPIVQSSTTKKVSVANLTAGRAVQMSSLDANGGSSTGGAVISGSISGVRASSTVVDVGDGHRYLALGANTSTIGLIKLISASSDASIYNYIAESDSNSNLKVTTGNLVIGTAGKGIDFSATPGTGTSELLADYEEGTWTVVWTNLTGTPASTTGYYTKIGRMVYFTYSTDSGSLTATAGLTRFSLPFAPAIEASGTQISQNVNFDFTTLIVPSNSTCYVGTFNSNFMVFSGAYNV